MQDSMTIYVNFITHEVNRAIPIAYLSVSIQCVDSWKVQGQESIKLNHVACY